MTDSCLRRRRASSGIAIFLQEELGDARLRCNQLKDYINEAVELIEKSEQREHFVEVAGHLMHGIPDTLLRMEKALGAAAMAVSKWDYEETKEDLRPEKAEQLEDALKDVRTRRVQRRSSNPERTMKTKEAAQELNRIARSIDQTGHVDNEAIGSLIVALEGNGRRIASSNKDVAGVLRGLAKTLSSGESRPSRAVLASALRRVFAETMDVGSSSPPPLPEPGYTPYSLVDGFDNIRESAIAAFRRGAKQPRQAFVDLAAIVQEIGLMCESVGSADVVDLAARMGKAVLRTRQHLKPEMLQAVASEKTAANLAVQQMLRSFADGSNFGGFDVHDVHGAADRLEDAAMKAAKQAFQYRLDSPPTKLFTEIAERVHDLTFYMGAAIAEPAVADANAGARALAMASDKTAAAPGIQQMINAFREGAEFGEYEMRDVRGAAMRVGIAAKAAAKYATTPNALATKMPIQVFTELAERLYDLAFYVGSASAALAKTARFEEGKPADPTKDMDEADASEWKENTDKYEDKFKAAATIELSRFEEGKPADPTQNMSEEDAEEWKTEHDKNKDNFKEAADDDDDESESKTAWTKAKDKDIVPKVNKNKKYAEDDRLSRFEEGKPADPTQNMSEEDAEEWKTEHDKNKDNFKSARKRSVTNVETLQDPWKV